MKKYALYLIAGVTGFAIGIGIQEIRIHMKKKKLKKLQLVPEPVFVEEK